MSENTELIIQVRLIERRHLKSYTIERTLDRRDIATVPTLRDGEDVLDWYERDELVPPEQIEEEMNEIRKAEDR